MLMPAAVAHDARNPSDSVVIQRAITLERNPALDILAAPLSITYSAAVHALPPINELHLPNPHTATIRLNALIAIGTDLLDIL